MRSSLRQASAELRLPHRVVSSVYLHLTDLCACLMARLNIGLSLGHWCDLSLFNRRWDWTSKQGKVRKSRSAIAILEHFHPG